VRTNEQKSPSKRGKEVTKHANTSKTLIGMRLLPLAAIAVLTFGCQERETPQALPTPEVTVAMPQSQEVIEYERFTGRTVPLEQVELRARVSGYLTKILFQPGAEVKKGDLLFEIDPRPYKAALDQVEADIKQAEARVKRLTAEFARAATLLKSNAISREEYDKTAGDQAETVAIVESTKARLESAQLDYQFTKITAPISGQIGDRLVDVGNLVVGGQANTTHLTTIVAMDPMYVAVDIDENTMQRVQQAVRDGRIVMKTKDQEIPIEMGLPINKSAYPFKGTIDFFNNRIDPKTGTIKMKALFANPKPEIGPRVLTPGMFVRVRIPMGEPKKSLVVPESALGTDQGSRFLYVVNDKNQAVRLEATVGVLQDGFRVIEQVQGADNAKARDLRPDERVIVKGLQRVRPGMTVDPKTK
jgi:membrane fusion protein, multidrug efflux system